MNKEYFISLIKESMDQYDKVSELYNSGIDLISSPLIEYGDIMFDRLLKVYFTNEGYDWISWWLYERRFDSRLTASDENGEIPMDTLDDLWDYVKQYLKNV